MPNTLVEAGHDVSAVKDGESVVERSYRLGAAFHMTKPFDPDRLVEAVRRVLDMSDTEVAAVREQEADKAHLLSQLEAVFGK